MTVARSTDTRGRDRGHWPNLVFANAGCARVIGPSASGVVDWIRWVSVWMRYRRTTRRHRASRPIRRPALQSAELAIAETLADQGGVVVACAAAREGLVEIVMANDLVLDGLPEDLG